jgi:hypothetical protein
MQKGREVNKTARLFGDCPTCVSRRGRLSILGAVMIIAAVAVWIWSAWR